jgi:putative ABC transport system permease protein
VRLKRARLRAIDRKVLRDLWHMRTQALAISLVMGSGVAMYVTMRSTMESLWATRSAYYERYRFADVFASVKRAPQSLASRIAAIPGVARVEMRTLAEVTLDVEGLAEPASGRLVSIPETDLPRLNDLYLRRGRYLEAGREGEVLVSEAFAEAHGFQPGDTVSAVVNGRRRPLTMVGVALSPEYVYSVRPGDFFPDDERFGIFWMAEPALAAAFDMKGAFNDVALALMTGASEKDVIDRLDLLLAPYGGLGAYSRSDQVSNWYLSEELNQLRANATVVPAIFLGVASFLLNVVLGRLIGTQRDQIGALKAFGYSHAQIGAHYLKMILLVAAVGMLLGAWAGAWLGRGMTEMYQRFYRFPIFSYQLGAQVMVEACAISLAAAVLGAMGAVQRAVRLPAAEAMRPEAPARYRPTLLERLGLQRFLSQPSRMIFRQLERRPVRSLLAALGIALAAAIMVAGRFSLDSVDYIIDFQFHAAQREDVSLSFLEAKSRRALHEVEHLPGVRRAEPFRAVAVRLRRGHRSRRVAVTGLSRDADLHRVLDRSWKRVTLPPEGLVLSDKLAELLQVRVGETLAVEVLEGRREVREVPVAGIVEEFLGTSAYMEIDALHRLLREGPSVSGAFLMVDDAELDALHARLKETPAVAGVLIRRAALASFEETIAENLTIFTLFNILFAGVIAFGVVYNSARIALSERGRELATLRVLGLTRAEISYILLGELAALTAVGVPVGLVLGYLLAGWAVSAFETELYRFPLIIDSSTYGFAAATVLVAAVVSGLIVRRRLDRLDLVAVLKSRE